MQRSNQQPAQSRERLQNEVEWNDLEMPESGNAGNGSLRLENGGAPQCQGAVFRCGQRAVYVVIEKVLGGADSSWQFVIT